MSRFANVRLTESAVEDLRGLAQQDPALVLAALRVAAAVDRGEVVPRRLRNFGKTGDLRDCSKVAFGLGDDLTHRMVFVRDGERWQVLMVIVVEERTDDVAYLLAGLRLGRITDPVARSQAQRRVERRRRRR